MLLLLGAGVSTAAPDDRWRALRDDLEDLQQRHRVPMLVLVIADDARPVLVHASVLDGRAATDRPFRWGSISKTVTALVALEAARRHGVDIDTPVARLLPDPPYRNPWAEQQPLRLGHLLELSAGLPDLSRTEFADNTPRPLGDALARGAETRVLLWPPGLQHSYSNVPPGLTAAVVERITGQPFERAAHRLVFGPLGMDGASFRPVPGLPGGFRAGGREEIPYWHMTFESFGALNAPAADMARLLQALLDEGRVDGRPAVAAGNVARMYRSETTLGARHGLEIGYGAGLYGWFGRGHLFHGHGGDADGYRSRLGLLPGARRGYLVGINVDDPALLRRMQRHIEQALTNDRAPLQAPPAIALDTAALTRYAGTYYPASARFAVARWQTGAAVSARIEVTDGGLEFRRGERRVRLLPVAPGRFRRPEDRVVSLVFAEREGTLFLQGELGNFARLAPGCAGYVPACDAGRPGADRPGAGRYTSQRPGALAWSARLDAESR